MKITLKELSLLNFKGIRELKVEFQKENFIFGRNTSGKTTLMDAFLWDLFGKDSTDRSDSNFELKTLDENNKPYHKLSHEVTAILDVDGEEITLRKVYREKWVKKRGSSSEEFAGHEKDFFWNEVPMKESDYQAKISSIFGDERIIKLITNVNYFNAMKWQDRRSVLLQLAGKIEDADILKLIANADNKEQIALLTKALTQKKSIDDFKAELYNKKKKIKDELILLPSRIDEAKRNLPEEADYSAIEALISDALVDIANVDSLLMSKTKAQKEHQEAISKLLNERQDIKQVISNIEFYERNKVQDRKREREQAINDINRDIQNKDLDINRIRTDYNTEKARKERLEKEQADLRDKWALVNNEVLLFDEDEFACPTCKREFEPETIDIKKTEFKNNFNSNKSKKLADISASGKKISEEIKAITVKISNLEADGQALKLELSSLSENVAELKKEHERLSENDAQQQTKAIASNKEYQSLIKEIDVLNERINAPTPEVNNDDLIQRKKGIQHNIDDWKKEIASKDIRVKMLHRIDELTGMEETMAQELASLEGIEFCIQQFMKAKMDELENRINGRFKLVKFKMFEEQINGGEKETCVTLINGVPYADANTAAKIQSGLDIINTLSDHYGIEAPVWVDNRESVTDLPETNCQLISLIVSPKDKKLRIETSAGVLEEVA
ncbi:MAG: AAA family ATPase [Ginsengibacter sp.]